MGDMGTHRIPFVLEYTRGWRKPRRVSEETTKGTIGGDKMTDEGFRSAMGGCIVSFVACAVVWYLTGWWVALAIWGVLLCLFVGSCCIASKDVEIDDRDVRSGRF